MPDSGSTPNQAFSREVATFTGSDAWAQLDASGRKILSVDADEADNDIAAALNNRLMKDGGNWNADVPIQSQKFTGVGNATARTHFAAAGQVADGALIYAGTSSGTDTITATLAPAVTAYATGMLVAFKAGGTNTGSATLNINSVSATNLRKGPDAATALAAGDITTGGMYIVSYTGSVWHLLNPKTPVGYIIGTDVQAYDAGLADIAGLAVTDGNIIVGDGSNWVAESGSTARTSLGIVAASDTAAGIQENAVQSEMETGTSTTLNVTPGRQHFHPGHPKFWGMATVSAGAPTLQSSYNVTSITDTAVGRLTVTIATDFSSANWCCLTDVEDTGGSGGALGVLTSHIDDGGLAAGTVLVQSWGTAQSSGGSLADPDSWHVMGLGDQS